MSEAETKQIVGQCVEITEKNGWTSFSVDVGTQYPVRLSTKVAAIIEQGRAIGADVGVWTFKESQGNENPNKPGTYYMNRYLDKAEPATGTTFAESPGPGTAGTASGTPVPTPHHEPIAPADKERTILRQTCLKVAGTLFTAKGNVETVGDGQRDNVSELLAAADRMERWVMRDIDEVPF